MSRSSRRRRRHERGHRAPIEGRPRRFPFLSTKWFKEAIRRDCNFDYDCGQGTFIDRRPDRLARAKELGERLKDTFHTADRAAAPVVDEALRTWAAHDAPRGEGITVTTLEPKRGCRTCLLLLAVVLAGCVTAEVDRALDAAARAENRIGASGASALSSVAALATKTGEAVSTISAVASEARPAVRDLAALVADARTKVEGGWLSRVTLALVVLLVGGLWYTHRRVAAVHRDLKEAAGEAAL